MPLPQNEIEIKLRDRVCALIRNAELKHIKLINKVKYSACCYLCSFYLEAFSMPDN